MRTLVAVHVFYPQFLDELAACVGNIDGVRDVIATYVDDAVADRIRACIPEARLLRCENCGYDVWPFLRALGTVRLADYDCVVKLHTKRDVTDDFRYDFNHTVFNGRAWRDYLLSFVRTPQAWRRTAARLSASGVGMVADRHVILRRRDVPIARTRESFDAAMSFLGLDDPGVRAHGQYVAGTMFAAKPAALAPLLARRIAAEMFEPPAGHKTETFAHVLERAFGLSVTAAGMRLVAASGSVSLRRFYAPFCSLLRRGRG